MAPLGPFSCVLSPDYKAGGNEISRKAYGEGSVWVAFANIVSFNSHNTL